MPAQNRPRNYFRKILPIPEPEEQKKEADPAAAT